jgi:hypothetical protein
LCNQYLISSTTFDGIHFSDSIKHSGIDGAILLLVAIKEHSPLIRTKENPYLTKTRSSFETSDPFLFFRTALDMKLDTVKQSQTQKFNDNGLLTGIWKGLL